MKKKKIWELNLLIYYWILIEFDNYFYLKIIILNKLLNF